MDFGDLLKARAPSLTTQRRLMTVGFPLAVVEPGQECRVTTLLEGPFRGTRLLLVGQMDEVRGHFKIRHTRLPLLNRDNVIAYSNVTRRAADRRTTVEYREHDHGNFVRSYLPSSVQYVHIDPLFYISLRQIFVGKERAMCDGAGVNASFLGAERHGNGFPMPSGDSSITLVLANIGDIQVRVSASIFGVGL